MTQGALGTCVFGPSVLCRCLLRFAGQYRRHSEAMRLQMRVEGIGGELHEVGGHPQALKLALAIVIRIGHGGFSRQEAHFAC
jgi:hypothetical protein